MTRRNPHLGVQHMIEHAREALGLAAGKTRADLDQQRELELSLVRLLEIVGEAASRVPAEERKLYPEVPWRDIVDLRNRLIHGYDSVDLDVIWRIVCADLPALLEGLEQTAPEV
jgi:uncharacterized protein with HEPN domain